VSKFRKKPVVIDAVQWTGENTKDMYDFARDSEGRPVISCGHPDGMAAVCTLEYGSGTWQVKHWASPGDWIIKGIAGEFYPCKPDIFAATYEPEPSPSSANRAEGRP
jgi:hypothetical protein